MPKPPPPSVPSELIEQNIYLKVIKKRTFAESSAIDHSLDDLFAHHSFQPFQTRRSTLSAEAANSALNCGIWESAY